MKRIFGPSLCVLLLAWAGQGGAQSSAEKFSTAEMLGRLKRKHPGPSDVLELGKRKDPQILQELRARARDLDQAPQAEKDPTALLARKLAAREAKIAAARQGAKEYFDEIVQGLSSADGEQKLYCIKALGYIGDRAAIKHLVPLLDDNGSPYLETPDWRPPRYSEEAATAIASLMPKDDLAKLRGGPATAGEIQALLKRWWRGKKAEYRAKEFGREKAFAEPR